MDLDLILLVGLLVLFFVPVLVRASREPTPRGELRDLLRRPFAAPRGVLVRLVGGILIGVSLGLADVGGRVGPALGAAGHGGQRRARDYAHRVRRLIPGVLSLTHFDAWVPGDSDRCRRSGVPTSIHPTGPSSATRRCAIAGSRTASEKFTGPSEV